MALFCILSRVITNPAPLQREREGEFTNLCVSRKLKFAAGLFILVNHVNMKSLNVLATVPMGVALNAVLQWGTAFQPGFFGFVF